MKVILQQNVLKLGKAGDIVEASPGYFRNFLQPRHLAVLATDGTLKKREEDLVALKRKADKAHQEAVELGEKIQAVGTLSINAKAGDGGKLYGKITNKEIASVLCKELNIDVDKRLVRPVDDIGALGTYRVVVKISPEVQSEFLVDVIPEGAAPRPKQEPKVETTTEEAEQESEELEEETASA